MASVRQPSWNEQCFFSVPDVSFSLAQNATSQQSTETVHRPRTFFSCAQLVSVCCQELVVVTGTHFTSCLAQVQDEALMSGQHGIGILHHGMSNIFFSSRCENLR